ncbi:MAG TPA: hypothetical protein V6D17_16105 [Candidatus Obscuribacterales bacterium]
MLGRGTISDIVNCRLPESEIVAQLSALAPENIDADLIASFVEEIRATTRATDLNMLARFDDVLDCSGTGGSGLSHFNTSTLSALVLAAAGVRVAKFGNRSSRGGCGSFDLLEAVGIRTSPHLEHVCELLETVGLAYLFAPRYYPCLAKLAPARRQIGKATIFNYIGPLLNPVAPRYRVFGVSNAAICRAAAQYLCRNGIIRAFVVRSYNGLDELMPGSANLVYEVAGGDITDVSAHFGDAPSPPRPSDAPSSPLRDAQSSASASDAQSSPGLGEAQSPPRVSDAQSSLRLGEAQSPPRVVNRHALQGSSGAERLLAQPLSVSDNVRIFYDLIEDPDSHLFFRDLVCMNAGAGLMVAGKVSTIGEGIATARALLKDGAAKEKFEALRGGTHVISA